MKKFLITIVALTLSFTTLGLAQEPAEDANPPAEPTPAAGASAPSVAATSVPKAGGAQDRTDTVVEDIVARVNNDIITTSDYERSQQQLQEEIKQDPTQATHAAERQRDVLRDLIDQDLLVQKGKDLGVNADNELIKRLDQIRKKMNLESMDELEKAAQEQGVSYEDFKSNLRNQIITQQVISQEVGSHIQITKEEEQKFYDEHKSELQRPEQVQLREILVAIPQTSNDSAAGPDPQVVAAAQAKAEEIEQQLKGGAKFEDVAKKLSEGPTAQQGGELGYFKRGSLAKQLEDISFGLKPGEFSQPIRTKQGYLILQVTDHQAAGLPPLSAVQSDIDSAIYYQKLQPALREYLAKLRDEAYIKLKPGYVDSGASARAGESTIVMTSAAQQQEARAKKKKKKLLIF